MILQINKPEKGDPFFNNAKSRYPGISTCITGNPVDPDNNTLANCVAITGAYNKAAQDGKRVWGPIMWPPNAGGILDYAKELGLPTSQTPAVGALIVWKKGALTKENKNGHVAFVYKVGADSTIYTAESEWEGRAWVNRSYRKPYFYANGYTFLGFVLQPHSHTIGGVIRKGDRGADVELMQARLHALGYLRKNEIDGDFGVITLGALLAFQFENKLEVDGVCGPKTKEALLGG